MREEEDTLEERLNKINQSRSNLSGDNTVLNAVGSRKSCLTTTLGFKSYFLSCSFHNSKHKALKTGRLEQCHFAI